LTPQAAARLWSGCEAMGIELDAAQKQCFVAFDALLNQTNAAMDLTAVLDPEEAVDRHYLDSLTVLCQPGWIPQGARIVDVGAGAGFPGIPLLIARPDIQATLLDAQRKRVDFLRRVIEALDLCARAFHLRAEDAARQADHRECYDVAVARAVAGLPALLELTLPLVRVGGRALAWKGPAVFEEFESASRAAVMLGGRLCGPVSAPVPGRDWHHLLIAAEKENKTVRQYPRKAGIPARKPLGILS